MISSRKHQLVIALILACTFISASGVEPNLPETQLRFEINSEEQQWKIEGGKVGKGPIKPTYVAEFFISDYIDSYEEIFGTSAGQSMSRAQRNFLTATKYGIVAMGYHGDKVRNHFHIRLYAVSEDDAKKMAQALIEALTEQAKANLQRMITKRKQLQENIAEAKEKISEAEAELKTARPKFEKFKKTVPNLTSEQAHETVSELSKMFNTMNIEITGMRSRMQTIETYQTKLGKEISGEHRFKLEQMLIEQIIELRAAEARRSIVISILGEAQSFCKLEQKVDKLDSIKYNLSNDLTRFESRLGRIEEDLAAPDMPDMLPPKVYQNKVTIYPVRVDE